MHIEVTRTLCNLARNPTSVDSFLDNEKLLDAIEGLLSHHIQDLVYFNVGLIMNLSLTARGRKLMTKRCLTKLCGVLRDSEIENIELSKVVCKAISNFCQETQFWTEELRSEVDEIVSSIGEDLDSIVEMAKPDDR